MQNAQPHVLTLVTPPESHVLSTDLLKLVGDCLGVHNSDFLAGTFAIDLRGIQATPVLEQTLTRLLAPYPIDWCLQNEEGRRKKLLISDMDSTIIAQECIDELAAYAGIGEKVAAITERAMQGELDFAASLTQRVALLEGLPSHVLQTVLDERITLNAGAKELVKTMRAHGAYTMLVSGGFTFFTSAIAARSGFEVHHANTLDIANDRLTGCVIPPILDKQSKRALLEAALGQKELSASQSIAVGDGANDAEMIAAAGLGVAYYAKPLLQSLANASINHTDLTTLLYFQGYSIQEIQH